MSEKMAERSSVQIAHALHKPSTPEPSTERSVRVTEGIPAVDWAASQLSALVDDELTPAEMEGVVRRLNQDHEVRQRWARYQLISDVLQGHMPPIIHPNFATRLQQAIEREPLPQPRTRWTFRLPRARKYHSLSGWAMAAGVILAIFWGLQLAQPDTSSSPTSPPIATSSLPVPPPPLGTQTVATVASRSPSVAPNGAPAVEHLNSYLVSHNGQASRNSVNGMLPYVRLVGYQTQQR